MQPNRLLTEPNCRARRALSESGLKSAETWAKRQEKAKIPVDFLVIFGFFFGIPLLPFLAGIMAICLIFYSSI